MNQKLQIYYSEKDKTENNVQFISMKINKPIAYTYQDDSINKQRILLVSSVIYDFKNDAFYIKGSELGTKKEFKSSINDFMYGSTKTEKSLCKFESDEDLFVIAKELGIFVGLIATDKRLKNLNTDGIHRYMQISIAMIVNCMHPSDAGPNLNMVVPNLKAQETFSKVFNETVGKYPMNQNLYSYEDIEEYEINE